MNRHSYRKERQRDSEIEGKKERVFAKLVEYLRTATFNLDHPKTFQKDNPFIEYKNYSHLI
jgi:hypothetical protein